MLYSAACFLVVYVSVIDCVATSNLHAVKPQIALTSTPLPWSSSMSPTRTLTYMPMLCAQLDLIKEMGMEQVQLSEKLVYCNSESKPARIANLEFRNDKFRKVRMTYFDGGDAVQVFNTLWYPSYEYDAPLLGVDLISLGLQRVLTVIDFQPLHVSESYSNKHIDHLAPTRNKYPDLHGVLSGKIYDDTSFFSKQMLFGRFTDESKVESVVQPAFTDYLNTYVNMVSSMKADHDETAKAVVQSRQKAYDEYSALKDPAVGLFDAYFGKEWSNAFVHEFLFGLCERNEHKQTTPVHNFKFDAQGQVGVSTGASSQFRFSAQT